MTSTMIVLTEDESLALKNWAREHGYTSKSTAAVYMLEWWLREKGYMEGSFENWSIDNILFDEGYENV